MEEQGTIFDVLKGEESVKVEHIVSVNPRSIVVIVGIVLATAATVFVARKLFGD